MLLLAVWAWCVCVGAVICLWGLIYYDPQQHSIAWYAPPPPPLTYLVCLCMHVWRPRRMAGSQLPCLCLWVCEVVMAPLSVRLLRGAGQVDRRPRGGSRRAAQPTRHTQ
jgi:hypothetical protein